MRSQRSSIGAGVQENVISCYYTQPRFWECSYGVVGQGEELVSGGLVLVDVMNGAFPSILPNLSRTALLGKQATFSTSSSILPPPPVCDCRAAGRPSPPISSCSHFPSALACTTRIHALSRMDDGDLAASILLIYTSHNLGDCCVEQCYSESESTSLERSRTHGNPGKCLR